MSRLILFHAAEHGTPILLWGEPVDPRIDVGLALAKQQEVKVRVWDMANPEDVESRPTEEVLTVKTLFSPLNTKRHRMPERPVPQNTLNPIQHSSLNLPADQRRRDTARHGEATAIADAFRPRRPQIGGSTKQRIKTLDTSLCPDLITFVPNMNEAEEMHIHVHLVIMNRGCDISNPKPEDMLKHVTGYSLAVVANVRELGDIPEQPNVHHGVHAFCPFGPVMLLATALPDPSQLVVTAVVNGIEQKIKPCGADLGQIQDSMVAFARKGRLWNGSHMIVLKHQKAVDKYGNSLRIKRGDKLVIRASHGMGHLINSVYEERPQDEQ